MKSQEETNGLINEQELRIIIRVKDEELEIMFN